MKLIAFSQATANGKPRWMPERRRGASASPTVTWIGVVGLVATAVIVLAAAAAVLA
jgi:hypothetical protein